MAASKWFRRAEIALWVLGMCLLGAASGATVVRWDYQRQQERALFSRGPAVSFSSATTHAARTEQPITTTGVAPVLPGDHVERLANSADRVVGPFKPALSNRPAIAARRDEDADPSAVGRLEIPRLGIAA